MKKKSVAKRLSRTEPKSRLLDSKKGEIKMIKAALEQDMKPQRGSRSIAILFL